MTPTPLNRRQFSIATGAALVAGFHTAQAQEERIVLGQSAAFTGPAAQLGIQFHAGAKLYFDLLNAQGGVELFPNQSSGVLTSAVWADGLIDLPSGQVVQRGDMVRLLPLSALIGA